MNANPFSRFDLRNSHGLPALVLFLSLLAGPGTLLAQYIGADNCLGACHFHQEQYNQWLTSGHRFILTEGQQARHRNLPLPEQWLEDGKTWDDISYVIGGNKTKALYLDEEGHLYTPSSGNNQYNLLTGEWVDYHAGETKPYDCGACHTTGYQEGGFPENLPGISGTFALPGVQCEHCHGQGMAMEDGDPAICQDCHVHGDESAVKASGGFIVSEGQHNEFMAGPHSNAEGNDELEDGCVSCHNPHQPAELGIKRECSSCHADVADAYAETTMDKAGVECTDCHMPPATLSGQALGPNQGDMKTHIFYVNTDPNAAMFTEDGANVALSDGKAAVTLDFVCQRCHQGASLDELARFAKDFHDPDKTLEDIGLDPGLSGTWWNSARSGEGFVLEFGENAQGELFLFASLYTYDGEGNQVWLVATGIATPGENTVETTVVMPVDGKWGEDLVPADVNRIPWGSGTFTFPTCSAGTVSLEPNSDMEALGFTSLGYDITRILARGIQCPTFASNTQ